MSIGEEAFYGCKSLIIITIPNCITSMGCLSFGGCKSLTSIFYKGTKEDYGNVLAYDGDKSYDLATKYFYSEELPTEKAHFWHYVDGVETIL